MFGHDENQFTPPPASNPPTSAPVPEPTGTLDDDNLGDLSLPPVSNAAPEPTNDDPFAAVPAPSTPTPHKAAPVANDDLLALKQQALQQLTPLVGHLEQSPEEKFRTTMMMIQASDDQSMLQSAYDAAQAITDEKAKAQALLDVVNEINYFTQHGTPPEIKQ